MKKNKKIYEAPLLTVVEFRTEKGFAGSDSLVMGAQQAIDGFVNTQFAIHVAEQNGNDEPIGAGMNGNFNMTNPGGSSDWQYSNGGWF